MPFIITVSLTFVVIAAVGYLLGSISFAVIFTAAFTKKDVREQGSGNAGMTNVLRTAGALPGALTAVCDFSKAAVSAAFGMAAVAFFLNPRAPQGWLLLPVYGGVTGGVFCMIGHIFPVFFQFRGGKGIMTALGAIAVMDWRVACIILGVFFIVLFISRIVSLSSIIAALSYPVTTFFINFFTDRSVPEGHMMFLYMPPWLFATVGAVIMAAITISKHDSNIKRLLRGEEKRMKVKK